MFLAKLKMVSAAVLVVGIVVGGMAILVNSGATAQQPDVNKTDTGAKDKKPLDAKDAKDAKNADAKNRPAATGDKKSDPLVGLKERLKKHEEEIAKIRKVMLKEIDDEMQKLDVAIKKARDAQKAGDRAAFQRAGQLTGEKMRLNSLRIQVEHGVHVGGARAPVPNIEQQLGIHVAAPQSTLRQQLALAKDQGLVLDRVNADSIAAKAGLQAHDIITQVDGKAVSSDPSSFRKTLTALAGKNVNVGVIRKGKQETIKGLKVPASTTAPVSK